jgi:hypothetical protein
VIAAVNDVLPWSTWPIVPMLQWGFVRSNFAFAMTRIPVCLVSYGLCARKFHFVTSSGLAGSVFRPAGAGEGNRTLVISLEGCCSTIELHPLGDTSFARAAL